MDMTGRFGLSGGNGSLLFPSGSLLFPLLVGYLSGCQRGGVGHMDAEEKQFCERQSCRNGRYFCNFTVENMKNTPESARDGSIGGSL
ncbi:MAG: hypothetical protein K2N05_09470 [Muribaculaceae bacterium]|nr:hypothetical protein [Muribaculaceae bacterium]